MLNNNRRDLEKLAYTVSEGSDATGMGETNLRRRIKDGQIRVVRVGRRILIPRDELLAWLNTEKSR